ncbi:amidohydrolase family protein [Brevibacillus parabrevis]|uniref:amidohydrolase family protein n=1 Tax=Brevibacillus parabrevis TaxID=54914 RepID=UPI0028D450A1|nr:amidohydrolase family protein [Brevibacillus parabrevis]
MSEQGMVIRGGAVVTAYGIKEADLWVHEGKIVRIAKDTLPKTTGETAFAEVDASDMYLLPGFVALPTQSLYKIKDRHTYIEVMQGFVRSGCTSFADVFLHESWMSTPQMEYQQTRHFNSPLDYVWHVGIGADQLQAKTVARYGEHGLAAFHVSVRSPEEISTIKWETLLQLHTSKQTILHLHIQNDASVKKEQRDQIRQLWLDATKYWKVRTVIADPSVAFETREHDPFLHIFRLPIEVTDRGIRHMHQHFYDSWQVAAPLHDVRIDYRRRWCSPERLLCLLVRLASTNVAKAVGLYPQKGSLTPGADADIVFLKKENWLTKYDLSTILNFSEMHLPTSVMSNGKWLYRNAQFSSSVGMGRRLFDTKPYAYVI